jgi:hypothetical protein
VGSVITNRAPGLTGGARRAPRAGMPARRGALTGQPWRHACR